MSDDHSILRQKLALPDASAGGPDDAGQQIGQAVARALRDRLGLLVEVGGVARGGRVLAELIEDVADHALLYLVEAGRGSLGALWMDATLRAAVIEIGTLGRVGRGDVVARRPTRLDATLAEGFAATMAEALGRATGGPGLALSSFLDDLRPLALILEDGRYDLLSMTLTLGEGDTRQGRLWLALPAAAPVRPERAGDTPREVAEPAADWSMRIERAVLGSSAELDATLGRLSLPLAEVLGLKPGMVLTLPLSSLDAIDLVDATGARLARGRLGQSRGHRALRIGAVSLPDQVLAAADLGMAGVQAGDGVPVGRVGEDGTDAGRGIRPASPRAGSAAARPALAEIAPA